jgi:glycosyltransferase involved in cell wall biosynthesis
MKVVIAQKGSRAHFLDARCLFSRGMLAKLVIDWYAGDTVISRLPPAVLPKPLAKALSARAPGLDARKIKSLNAWGILYRAYSSWARSRSKPYDAYLWSDRHFAGRVARLNLPEHDIFYTFSYAGLEALQAARMRGAMTVLNQIDAGAFGFRLVAEEARRWPEYAKEDMSFPEAYFSRVQKEWEISDLVLVNSEWSRHALVEQGVSFSKIEVIPLAFERPMEQEKFQLRERSKKTRVLWLGTVSIGKGIQYLVEAARMLVDAPVEFVVAGPLAVRQEALEGAPHNIQWVGTIPRSQVADMYRTCDVFVLPTLSDGFAITQIEALAYGLPVIVTPNCGRVVQDGETGFVIPCYSAESLAEAVLRFVEDPGLIDAMRPKCLAEAGKYTVEAYADSLVSILDRHLGEREPKNGGR